MDNIPYFTPPRWWEPRPSKLFMWLAGPYRKLQLRYWERISSVEVQGLEHLRRALDDECGILIVSNHASHSDPLVFLRASDLLGRHFYFMSNWQLFDRLPWLGQRVLQWHGCFSIDREGADVAAHTKAVELIRSTAHPLVVFAEGHLYHHYQRVAPLRAGASLFAQAAAYGSQRPVVCIPAAIVYRYSREPTFELTGLLARMERKLGLHAEPRLDLADRVRRVGDGVLELRERQYLGQTRSGSYSERAGAVLTSILDHLEGAHGLSPRRRDVPRRVTQLRRLAIQKKASRDRASIENAERVLGDVQVVSQLYSYLNDYDTDEPTFEHLAEILDKLEEDVLGVPSAETRGRRRAYIRFGPPVPVQEGNLENNRRLTALLHDILQAMVDELILNCGPWKSLSWSKR